MTAKWRPPGFENPYVHGSSAELIYEKGWDAAVEALRKEGIKTQTLDCTYEVEGRTFVFIPDEIENETPGVCEVKAHCNFLAVCPHTNGTDCPYREK